MVVSGEGQETLIADFLSVFVFSAEREDSRSFRTVAANEGNRDNR